jgi:flagellar FliL protein
VFVTLEPFVVNLAGDVQHYLQVGIDLRVVDGHVTDQIKVHLPEIRNGVLLLLSSKSVEDLSSVEQKNLLRAQIREVVNKPLGIDTPTAKPEAPKAEAIGEAQAAEPPAAKVAEHKADAADAGVLDVLLTSFVIQ